MTKNDDEDVYGEVLKPARYRILRREQSCLFKVTTAGCMLVESRLVGRKVFNWIKHTNWSWNE